MNVSQAMKKWELSEKKVYEVCRALKLPKGRHGYLIPNDMKTPYLPDRRAFLKKNRLHVYIHVLNAITQEQLLIPSLLGTDEQHIRTAVRELRRTEAIVLLEGAEDDLDYRHYMIGMNYASWTYRSVKDKLNLVSNLLGTAREGKALVLTK